MIVAALQQAAARLDAAAAFPEQEIAFLRSAHRLELALPVEQPERAAPLADALAAFLVEMGRGNLAVGRIVEAHLNARHLIARYGSSAQRDATDASALHALWVTDPPDNPLRMVRVGGGIRLHGGKQFCSAAGFASRALVTALDEDGTAQMLVLRLGQGERVSPLPSPLQGMRAAITGAVDFTGYETGTEAILGRPGDYLREPEFSAGAWRSSAVAAGGLCSLVDSAQAQLQAADRLDNPHQLMRLGECLIAQETALLWVQRLARTAEVSDSEPGAIVATVGLGRIAIETACLDALRLVQRSLGLAAFRQGNPVERIGRDLSTYLRQPAPDEVLTGAAAYWARAAPC